MHHWPGLYEKKKKNTLYLNRYVRVGGDKGLHIVLFIEEEEENRAFFWGVFFLNYYCDTQLTPNITDENIVGLTWLFPSSVLLLICYKILVFKPFAEPSLRSLRVGGLGSTWHKET